MHNLQYIEIHPKHGQSILQLSVIFFIFTSILSVLSIETTQYFSVANITYPTKPLIKAHPKAKVTSYRIKNRYLKKPIKFIPQHHYNYMQTGYASYYGNNEHGRKTASGEVFSRYAMTAAHRTLPLPTLVKVTNLENNKSVLLRVNDRGPYPGPKYLGKRIIDVSESAAKKLGFYGRKGLARVSVESLPQASLSLITEN